jgi:hypothetical protein
MYLLPLHLMFVDAKGRAAYAAIDHAGGDSLQILN